MRGSQGEFGALRGLPLAAAPPARPPAEGAAFRAVLCRLGPCAAESGAALSEVGFRCARSVP